MDREGRNQNILVLRLRLKFKLITHVSVIQVKVMLIVAARSQLQSTVKNKQERKELIKKKD